MNKKEIKARIKDLISSGVPKSEVFAKLSGQGLKDRRLALFIASYADPRLCDLHDRKVNVLITLMFIQAVLALLVGFALGAPFGPSGRLIVAGLCALVPLLFAFGFYKHHAGAYNAYLLLAVVNLPRQFEGFAANPIATAVVVAMSIAMLAYVCYVRQKLFPDLLLFSPKKLKGQYVFSR